LDVETLAADDWKILRDVRLRALEDSPTAYISSRQTEMVWTEARWRRTFEGALWVVARGRQEIVGLTRSVRVERRPAFERHLESVWVEPGHRRTGVLRTLLRYLIELEPDVREWLVWVLTDNVEARTVYERLGFQSTGERQPLDDSSDRSEERLRLSLGGNQPL
jgi:L-amino acid N-acyltransferase YncA